MAIKRSHLERVEPRLRVVCNGDAQVNGVRAELSAAVRTSPDAEAPLDGRDMLQQAIMPSDVPRHREAQQLPKPPAGQAATDAVRVSCFIQLDPEEAGFDDRPRRANMVTAELTPSEVEEKTGQRGVSFIEMGQPLSLPRPAVSARHPKVSPADKPAPFAQPKVLVGVIDVGGFDFAHPDFRDADGQTRFVRIWDQGASEATPIGRPPARFDDGVEIHRNTMNEAIKWSEKNGVAATDLVRQSVQVAGAHATHVASIAAGNRSLCPDAAIAGVLIALSEDDRDRRASLYDSTRLAHAVDYLFDLGRNAFDKPVPTVINISLGTNGHAHDGSSAICRWIDAALMAPGSCVCVAAGNAGQEAPASPGDLGYLTGRIHASGRIPARGLETDIEWHVVGNGIIDVSENELEIWYEAGDEIEVELRSPSGQWVGPVRPGTFVENKRLPTETFVSIYNERFHPANGANRISVFLSPRLRDTVVGIESGTWLVRMRGIEVRDGRFDAWIERDDPRPLGRIGEGRAWRFPSYFTSRSHVDRSSVSSLACGQRVISVGNCDALAERIHPTSSQGPTRDGRAKPEIAAPGSEVVAARGFSTDERPWVAMTGTSMASPFVASVAARMLMRAPRLTSNQIAGIMRRTARPLPGSDYDWQDAAGYGRIDPAACIADARSPFEPVNLDKVDPDEESPS